MNDSNRYRWTILAVGSLAQSLYGALVITAATLAPDFQKELHLSLHEIGAALATVQGGSTFTFIAWGLLSDRVGERAVIVLATTATAGAVTGAALTKSPLIFIAFFALAGMAAAGITSSSGRAVMMWFTPSERGVALGIRQTAGMVGQAIAAAALPVVAALYSLKVALLAIAGTRHLPVPWHSR